MQQKQLGHTLALLANVFFGINFILVKLVVPSALAPFALNIIRVIGALVLFGFVAAALPKGYFKPIQKQHWPRLALAALCGITVNQLLFIKGLSITTATHGSLLMLVTPVFITLMAVFFLKEKLHGGSWLGLLIALSGAVALVLHKNKGAEQLPNMWLGDVLVLANAIVYSFYFITIKPLMAVYSPFQIIIMVFALGGIAMLPFCLQSLLQTQFGILNAVQWWQVGAIILLGTFGAYVCNVFSVQLIGTASTSAYIYTQPIFATVLAAYTLGESLHWYTVIASACIFGGVFLMNWFKRKS